MCIRDRVSMYLTHVSMSVSILSLRSLRENRNFAHSPHLFARGRFLFRAGALSILLEAYFWNCFSESQSNVSRLSQTKWRRTVVHKPVALGTYPSDIKNKNTSDQFSRRDAPHAEKQILRRDPDTLFLDFKSLVLVSRRP